MILTSVAVAGGMLATSVKVYQDKKRAKEKPWRVAAEKLERREQKRLAGGALSMGGLVRAKKGLMHIHGTQTTQIMPSLMQRLFNPDSDISEQQRLDLSPRMDEDEISDAEKEMDRYFAVSLASLGFSVAGSVFYAPLGLLSLPGLLYLNGWVFKRSFEYIFKENRAATGLIDIFFFGGTLLTGHYWAGSLLLSFYFLGRKLLLKTEDHSRSSLINVFGEQPRFVWIQQQDLEVEVPFESIQAGDVVIVHAGQTIPVDGIVASGQARVDQRALTGESQPVEKEIGQEVFAGTVLLSGRICVQVEKAGASTVAAQIGDILNSTADFKSSVQSRGETIVDEGAKVSLAIGALTLPILGPASAIAAVNAAFGCHMRIAAPISVLTFLRMASENGVLIKDGRSLELLSDVDTFVFDKTGTLTEEVPSVGRILICQDETDKVICDEEQLLAYAAAAEYKQTHPIAKSILREAQKRALTVPATNEVRVEMGYGLVVDVDGKSIRVGSRRFMEMSGITIPANIDERTYHDLGHSLVYLAIDKQLAGAIELKPTIRPETKHLVSELKKRNMSIVIISGDQEQPTKKLAAELGIEQYFAETLPENKASLIEQLQKEGKSVCFVGDGINDSIALKKANVSISLRGASSAATDSASMILMDGTLNQVIPLLDIADMLEQNLSSSVMMTIIPGVICIGGVFFFHLGIFSSIMLFNLGLVASVSNALLPLIKHQREISRKMLK